VSHRELLRELIGYVGDDVLDDWDRVTAAFRPRVSILRPVEPPPDRLARATAAERFRDAPDDDLRYQVEHLGLEAIAAVVAEHGARAALVVRSRDVRLDELLARDDAGLREAAIADTEAALAAVECLRDSTRASARQVRAALPLTAALAVPAPPQLEHEPPPTGITPRPLLDHLARSLDRKLAGLERRDRARFERIAALSDAGFARACAAVEHVRALGLLPAVRLALLHLDVAKGGDLETRHQWESEIGDLAIHNIASARLFRQQARGGDVRDELVHALIASHGLAGQHLRGETPRSAFAPFLEEVLALRRRQVGWLGLSEDDAVAAIAGSLHVIDIVDTAAVREGLLDDDLLAGLEEIRDGWIARGRAVTVAAEVAPALLAADRDPIAAADAASLRRTLVDRLVRLRGGRQRAGEPRADVEVVVAALGDDEAGDLAAALATCQLWYCEAATGALGPATQLRLLAAACGDARRLGVDRARPWHAQLQPLVARLGVDTGVARYRRRLVDAVLGRASVAGLLAGTPDATAVITAAATALGKDPGIAVDLRETDEAAALLTLLPIYERKSTAAFHATLKALCDLYGLRKDDFDRVANEAEYLASMNAARDDKARMLELVRPGRIVEVGPGGGIVLDLLEDRFPDSEIVGIDVSREVVAALAARRARDHRRWRIVEADAFALADHVGAASVDTVVFCSVLHEIYSYLERDGRRFQLDSVRDLLRAAWRALVPGGRIVIRDGIAPPPGTRRIRFLADDGRGFFELFAAQFEGFAVSWRDLPDGRVELPAHHAMEFLYTYTWGPASFPYEVREQYGVLTYPEYAAALTTWLDGAHLVPLPPALATYLQPGYVTALAPKIELTDEHDRPVPLPRSNCLLVVEKKM